MLARVRKWGNSLAVRIPKPFAEEADVKEGTRVDLSLEDGKFIVTPILEAKVTLRQLLSKIHPSNLHGEIDMGPARGRELL
ncbi:MAG TPA: AbrB/MazE/SpoVT family DNA-binding domain-containing protein [bacterium]|jgi:antitoxin MazE|nr:AbrB/MazE/SpoVT family DNA-binding domain-containing protein [bacterium]